MVKKFLFSLRYIFLALLVTSFLGACTPKKTSPVNDSLAEQNTTSVADANSDDDDEDSAWENDDDSVSPTERLAQSYTRSHKATGSTGELLQKARTALGTPYVRGGTSRDGFDCSGFVQWSYNSVGIQLPRTAREQSQVGTLIRRTDDMQAGDIVAFRHPKRGYHTGIYVGDGKFIHSPRKRNVVRINSLDDPYFSKTFMGARRLNVSNEGDIEAAEQMLLAYAKQPPSPKASASRSKSTKKQDKASRSRVASKKSADRLVALNTTKTTKNSSKEEKARSDKKAQESKSTKATKSSTKNTKADAPRKAKSDDKKSSATSSKSKADSADKKTGKKSEKASTKAANTKESPAKSSQKASAGDTKKSPASTSKKNTDDAKKSAR